MSILNRSLLSKEQKEFVIGIIPWSQTISDWILDKAVFLRIPIVRTIYPCIILADIIEKSQWGTHPLSQIQYKSKLANNLSLLEKNDLWDGKSINYEGVDYKLYNSQMHFSTDYSDLFVFDSSYKRVLLFSELDSQINQLSKLKKDNNYSTKIKTLIEFYELTQFN